MGIDLLTFCCAVMSDLRRIVWEYFGGVTYRVLLAPFANLPEALLDYYFCDSDTRIRFVFLERFCLDLKNKNTVQKHLPVSIGAVNEVTTGLFNRDHKHSIA